MIKYAIAELIAGPKQDLCMHIPRWRASLTSAKFVHLDVMSAICGIKGSKRPNRASPHDNYLLRSRLVFHDVLNVPETESLKGRINISGSQSR